MDHNCTECGLVFGHRQSLRRHERIVHSDVRLVCHHCGVGYKRHESLKAHLANHEALLFHRKICIDSLKHRSHDKAQSKRHREEKQMIHTKRIVPQISANVRRKSYSLPWNEKSVQVKIELGHRASVRKKPSPEGFTHDWVVFVRGPEGSNVAHFVDKVVFYLHESFPKPKRTVREPPYQVAESGYAGFNMPIEIHFRNKEEPRKLVFHYDMFLHEDGFPPVSHIRCEKLTFQNPTEDFRRRLIKAGGVGIFGGVEQAQLSAAGNDPPASAAINSQTKKSPPNAAPQPAPPPPPPPKKQQPESNTFTDLFGAPLMKADVTRKKVTPTKDKSASKSKSGSSTTPNKDTQPGTPTKPASSKESHSSSKDRSKDKASKRSAESPPVTDNNKKKRKESSSDSRKDRDKDRSEATSESRKDRDKERGESSSSKGKERERDKSKSHSSKEKERDRDKDSKNKSSHRSSSSKKEESKSRSETERAESKAEAKVAESKSSKSSSSGKGERKPMGRLADKVTASKQASEQSALLDNDSSDSDVEITMEEPSGSSPASSLSFSSERVPPDGTSISSLWPEEVLSPLPKSSPNTRKSPRLSPKSSPTHKPQSPTHTLSPIERAEKPSKDSHKSHSKRKGKDKSGSHKSSKSDRRHEAKENNGHSKDTIDSSDLKGKAENNDLSEIDLNGQKAPNGEYFTVLLELQRRLMSITDRRLLQSVVGVIQQTDRYKLGSSTLDFDLCVLDGGTVQRLRKCLEANT